MTVLGSGLAPGQTFNRTFALTMPVQECGSPLAPFALYYGCYHIESWQLRRRGHQCYHQRETGPFSLFISIDGMVSGILPLSAKIGVGDCGTAWLCAFLPASSFLLRQPFALDEHSVCEGRFGGS